MPVGFSFSLLDMARNRLGLGGVRLTQPVFIAFQVSGSRTFGIGLAALNSVLRNLQPPVSGILKLAAIWPVRGSWDRMGFEAGAPPEVLSMFRCLLISTSDQTSGCGGDNNEVCGDGVDLLCQHFQSVTGWAAGGEQGEILR